MKGGDDNRVEEDGASMPMFERTPIPSMESVEQERDRLEYRREFTRTFRSTLYILVVIAAVAVLLITLFFPILQVSGTSMEPTLEEGDIVVMMKPGGFNQGDLVGFYYQNKLLIKRVIAGPGEWVNITEDGEVFVNNRKLDEPYINVKSLGESDIEYPFQVPENRYFVMGDHRDTSIDSRNSVIGAIERDQIAGKIVFRIWPLDNLGFIE